MTTALTTTAAPATSRPPRGPRGLIWTVLRLHRASMIVWAVVFLGGAAVLLWAYGPGADAAQAEWDRVCAGREACVWGDPIYDFDRVFRAAGSGLNWLPALVAAWAGAALVGREMENGTARLAWTQGITPTRWLAAKLAVPAVLLTVGTTVLALLHRLVSDAHPLPLGRWSWYTDDNLQANGTVAIAAPLLGLATGVLAGLLLRRALPALAVAPVATGALEALATVASRNLVPWETAIGTLKTGYQSPVHILYGDQGALTSTGARDPDPLCVDDAKCLAAHDIVGFYTDYHPASHFWPLHLVETGLLLGAAALATAAAFRLLRRRTP
ncbi:ABC transporter permease [Streptomyces sp. DT2A-34]|uniref:ABC transporter permease n=1 Tax=Streptomyces sp. DT2A-34 TaxID=3051182 RepID=UPI00265C30BF|nr:ABC transporter permease [Streptomyces sp. DT2A-34]MDO0913757.1 ABC transporter permease [Streptomyces sp. DT2A-34]